MSELNAVSTPDSIALKRRLSGLSPSQRALLARRLEDGKTEDSSPGGLLACIPRARPLRVEESPRVAVFPASHGQQRMWFLHHYAPESPVYAIPTAFHLVGPLNVAWLEAAFHGVIQRHDILRTTFAFENDELLQRVAALSAFQLQSINLERIPADTRETSAEQRLTEEACRLFDLAAGPPFRAVLVRLQPTEHVLLVVFHHIISDGWSRSNFYRDLAAAYSALASGQSAPGCELPVQFADYSAWQRNWLQSGVLEAQTTYWKSKLAGDLEPLELPLDHARPPTESFRGSRCSICLDPNLTDALKTRAQEEGATLFMILLAAFKALLHRYTEQDDVIVGVPVANRQRVEVEGLIGFFATTLVMRTTLPGLPTFRELLRCVKETAIEAYANQDMPFERLVELLKVRRDASRTPLFQTTFALQDFPAATLLLPGIQTAPWLVTTPTSKFDLSLTVERSSDGWTATAEYCTDLFEVGRIERMLDHWRVMLESIAINPDQRVSELPLLTTAERHQVLVEWNRTGRDYPRDKCVHQLIEEQTERTPEVVALEFVSLTRQLTEENWAPPWKSLVPLQPLGAKPPFFLVHGWGGDVFVFLGLAQHLAPDQPAYGLQAVGLDGSSPRHTTVETMAAHYVQEIRSFQPEGPYYLGGYSMGGLIAFEMAQQLRHLGQQVALLALFDTVPICAIPWTVYGRIIPSYLCGRLRVHIQQWWNMPYRDRSDYFLGRWVALQHWIARNRSKQPEVTDPLRKDTPPPPVLRFGEHYRALASAYRLRRYPGSADIFVSDDAHPHWVSSWKQLAVGGVSYHRVSGKHLELLTPDHLPALSKALRTALLRAQETRS